MSYEDKVKCLETLPWQALFEVGIEKGISESELKGNDKSALIRTILINDVLEDSEIEALVNAYIYGDRVTFTLWSFDSNLSEDDIQKIQGMEGLLDPFVESSGFRNLQIMSVNNHPDRIEILYVYSKEYSFTNEEGHADSVWELHRGCIWIGSHTNYLASISKHDKMARLMIAFLAGQLGNSIIQIKPPKRAIERCINYKAISRIVLQSVNGEKTIISKSDGFTEAQEEEANRIRAGRFDTSGSYIAEISENTSATIKYNVNKGNIGIYKHLSSVELFQWSENAISIVLDEIEKLKGKPASEIFSELGIELKWTGIPESAFQYANWFLTEIIAAYSDSEERISTIPFGFETFLNDENLFMKTLRGYCEECESLEIPICSNCGEVVTLEKSGSMKCSCGAPITLTCGEKHQHVSPRSLYIPTQRFLKMLEKNVRKIYKDYLSCTFCVVGDELHITSENQDSDVEVPFSSIIEFQTNDDCDKRVVQYAIRMNEKCSGTCSFAKISSCVSDATMTCLPKVFYSIIPGYRPQPHMNGEYGDVSGQITVGTKHYEMKGIIKKNTKHSTSGRPKSDNELIEETLKSTSKEGQEILRQFVEQGLSDTRTEVIAVIAPQHFDAGLKGTIRYLARLGRKKVVFIELDELCALINSNENIAV